VSGVASLLLVASLLIPPGRPTPPLEVMTLGGNAWSEQLSGQITIVEFFATWCPHCRRSLAGYHALLAARQVRLIIVDVEEEPELVADFFTHHPPPPGAGVLIDPEGRARRMWGVTGFPAVYLLDKAGIVRDSFSGWSEDSARDLARQIDALNGVPTEKAPAEPKPPATKRRAAKKKPAGARPPTHDERARQLGVEVIR
jgi:thiol-disulfide isomerase/thioredoxin